MRNTLIILFLFISLSVGATTYYISPTGSDSNSGTSASPWKTLTYACSKVTAAGDIIHVNAGTYNETGQSYLTAGVSIEGDGPTSLINCTYAGSSWDGNTLVLSSTAEGTNGNQHIWNIKMSGGSGVNSEVALSPILVERRKNVEIANCTFVNFFTHGPMFIGCAFSVDTQPTTYPTGNSFHNNVVTNCSTFQGIGTANGAGRGCLEIGGQQDMLVYNNTLTVSYRSGGLNAYCIKYAKSGYNKGLKMYNNTLVRPPFSGVHNDFDFAVELWNCRGGVEIYGNTMGGGIDLGGDNPAPCTDAGGYGYAVKIHNNEIGWDSWQTYSQMGVDVERAQTGGLYIYKNHFKKLSTPIQFYQGYDSRAHDVVEDIFIYSNIVDGVGSMSSHQNDFIAFGNIPVDAYAIIYRRIYLINNTVNAGTGSAGSSCGLRFDFKGPADNIVAKNNIVTGFGVGFGGGAVYIDGTHCSSLTHFTLQDNLYYGNGTNGTIVAPGVTPSYDANSGNVTGNPNFVSSTDFHLTAASTLAINTGVATGLSFITTDYDGVTLGSTPEIGSYEYGSSAPPAVPAYQTSAIENATSSLLELTYDLSLSGAIVPASSSFSVLVNSIARTISSVAVSGTKVQLTLSSPVIYGDVVTVAYTKPATNPLQTASGGQAISISAQVVTNRVTAVSPAYVSSAIENATPSLLEMTYNLSLTNIVPAASSFSVLVNSTARTISSVVVSGTKVQLTLSSPVIYGDVVTVAYTKPATNPIQTTSGGQAISISAQAVTNRVTAVSPAYVSSAIENATPSLLEMTYNLLLASIVPAGSSFSVLVNSTARTISSVVVSGTKVQLILSSPVIYGDVVTVAYAKPATNPLQTTSGGQAISISAQAVTNRVTAVSPAYVSSAIENATPSLLEMTYNLSLASIVPAGSSFIVLVNSTAITISSLVVSGTKVQLTLSSPVIYGDVVTVAYAKPATNPLQTTSGGQTISISAQVVTNRVTAVSPAYVSSAIENATPSLLEMTYNLSLASIVPAGSSFSVLVNSTARTISSAVVSGTKVQLTLSSPVIYGDVVTVAYAKPATNPLQTTSGGQAISISTQTVTNRVTGIIPVYVGSSIANTTPAILEITYNMSISGIIPTSDAFSVLVNSVARTVNAIVITGTKVHLTLSSRVIPGDIVSISYIKPASNPIQSVQGITAAGFSNQPVINNCVDAAPVTTITSPVVNTTFTAAANIIITADSYDSDGTVSMVEFYNGATKIGSSTSAPYSFSWNNVVAGNYSLTVVATDNLNSKTTSSAVNISVVNSKPAANKHPVIKISNPRKGNVYDDLSAVTIDAVATDPDGTISKVEFYNGSEKLVEITAAPYSFTWKDVASGTYEITAIATDNSNDTTASAPIEFIVGTPVKYDAKSEIVNLYPNPNNGQFTIAFVNPLQNEKSEIVIADMAGKQVYQGPVTREEIQKQFDLSEIKSGMYVMMIRDKNIVVTKKFIKK
jgi:uncharacterized repeat protein (TIGR02059 family)